MVLILTRNKGKSIVLGEDVVITVLGADRGQARIGISAPKNIEIHRDEIYDKVHGEGSFTNLSLKLENK